MCGRGTVALLISEVIAECANPALSILNPKGVLPLAQRCPGRWPSGRYGATLGNQAPSRPHQPQRGCVLVHALAAPWSLLSVSQGGHNPVGVGHGRHFPPQRSPIPPGQRWARDATPLGLHIIGQCRIFFNCLVIQRTKWSGAAGWAERRMDLRRARSA